MSLRRRMPGAAFAALIALSLAACTPSNSTPTPSPTATRTPLFASDEEALKAATDAYAAYQRITDAVLHDGGRDPSRYEAVATGTALSKALSGAKDFRDQGLRTTGTSRFDSARVQTITSISVSFYVCDDVSQTDLLDSAGQSRVKPGNSRRTPWEVEAKARGAVIVISKRDYWSGSNFCER